MDDRQPLLNVSNKFSIDDGDDDDDNGNKKQLLTNSFSDWCRCFSRKGKDNKYIKLDDDTEHSDKDEAVGIFRLFRFANRMDFLTAKEAMNELMTYSKAGQIAQEVFSSLRTVLSLNGSKFEQKRYDRELYPTCWSSIRKGAVFGIFIGWLSLITYLVYSVGFIFGSLLMSHKDDHTLNISDILVVVSIFATGLNFFSFIGPFFQSFSEARGAAASVFRLIDEGNDASVNEIDVWKEDKEAIYNLNGDIEFDNINFSYPSRKDASVLRNLALIARAGETTALVGSSGCGKSTCISLFLRYYEPSSGRIMIDGRPITDYNVKQLRQNIGVVSQEPILFGMSIYENIRFGKVNATQAEIEQAAREANAHNFIMQLPDKYETLVGERGIQLSGGEKQRITLARALVKQPIFLLLDEATSALDNISEKIVQEALDRACKGRTTIVIAHRLTTIQNAHHIYVLDNGSVIEQGTHETLMAKEGGKYQTMVKRQQMERINDDQDDMMSIQKATEEDEKSTFERSHLLSDSQTVDVNKQTTRPLSRRFVFLRLLSMNSPEWITILIGCIACVLNGAAQPLCAFLLTQIVEVSDPFIQILFKNINNVHRLSSCIAASLSAAETFFDLFDRKPVIDNTSIEGQELVDFHGEIKFDQVKFIYPARPTSIILNKFQLNIKASQRVALVGTSGCGKSTIIQLLERFYDVTSGQLLIDGIDIRQLNLHWVRSQFGLVSQEPILFDLTIAENIAYGLENVPMEDIINAARKANIHQFIEQLPQGYETKVGMKGSLLSGGEKQRIAIARVLLRQPKVLLLDEATSAMDSHNEQIVQEALEQAQTEDSSRTSLIIAHRLSTIRSCDLICVLDRGYIVESGTHTELTQQHGAYYKMLAQNNLQ
ncbi:unnamed protein product [Rotaria sordida]|uniref:Uncharacterized protein n=1 Tax=Rotaria sordida TaxID=392033 RepID=A0A815U2Q7_9BILA|nr:unnamed protein product [Rotaria sordida]CAF1516502.1 unnamed protein product [Rotaria sordida]